MYIKDKNGEQVEAGIVHKISIMLDHVDQGKHSITKSYPNQELALELSKEVLLNQFEDCDYLKKYKGLILVEYFDSKEDMWEFEEYLEDPEWYKKEYGEDNIPEPQKDYFFFNNTKAFIEWQEVRDVFDPVVGNPAIREPHEIWDRLRSLFDFKEKYEEIKFRMDGLEK